MATFLSGNLVSYQGKAPILRSYYLNFIVAVVIVFLSYLLLFLLYIVKNRTTKQSHKNEVAISEVNNNNNTAEVQEKKLVVNILFDFENVRQTIVCFCKQRHDNVRLQIYLLCGVLFNQVLVTNGLNTVLLQFSEKVYLWSGSEYATFSALQQISQMSLLGLLLVVLVNVLKLQQNTLLFLSQISIFCTDLIRGLFLSRMAFFVTLPIGMHI